MDSLAKGAWFSHVSVREIPADHVNGAGWSDVQMMINEGHPSQRLAWFRAPDEVAMLLLSAAKETAAATDKPSGDNSLSQCHAMRTALEAARRMDELTEFDNEEIEGHLGSERTRQRWELIERLFPEIAAQCPEPSAKEMEEWGELDMPPWMARDHFYGLDAACGGSSDTVYALIHDQVVALRDAALEGPGH